MNSTKESARNMGLIERTKRVGLRCTRRFLKVRVVVLCVFVILIVCLINMGWQNLDDMDINSSQETPEKLPSWIETFPLSYEQFEPQSIPIVVFSSYRYEYLVQSLNALKAVRDDQLLPETPCVFVLHRSALTKEDSIVQTLKVTGEIDFCQLEVWEYNDIHEKPSASLYKRVWWSVMSRLFHSDSIYHKDDILFLEEDVVVSPDFVKVLWYSLRVKNTFGPDIHAVSLGGYIGANTINPHPDTFVVRKTEYFQATTYAFNKTFWDFLSQYKNLFFTDNKADFSEAISFLMGSYWINAPLHFVVPTLGRMWHIGQKGLGAKGDYSETRSVETHPVWAQSPRLIDIDNARVNDGIRDYVGFLCEPDDRIFHRTFRDNLCVHSLCNYVLYEWHKIVCVLQPYVFDKCLGDHYFEQNKCNQRSFKRRIADYYNYMFMKRWMI